MTDKKRRPAKKRPGSMASKSPYFLQPARQGSVTVLRRPAGNRIDAKLCGTMPSHAMAVALVKQLEKAESVVKDLFLEATDDGIEALEAVLEVCRQSVARRAEQHRSGGALQSGAGAGARRRGRARTRGAAPSVSPDSRMGDGATGEPQAGEPQAGEATDAGAA